jgi:hypothetical protein
MSSKSVSKEISGPKLGLVTVYALHHKEFRAAAGNPGTLENVVTSDAGLAKELEDNGLEPLNEAEIAYCLGWATLARAEFGDGDSELVSALNRTAGDDGPTP